MPSEKSVVKFCGESLRPPFLLRHLILNLGKNVARVKTASSASLKSRKSDGPFMNEPDSSQTVFWTKRWEAGKTPWDFGGVPPALVGFLKRTKVPYRVLIPGCGTGYEVRAFHEMGHDVSAIEFSAPAVAHAREVLGPLGDRVIHGNFFKHDFAANKYDLIYERGFLCFPPPPPLGRFRGKNGQPRGSWRKTRRLVPLRKRTRAAAFPFDHRNRRDTSRPVLPFDLCRRRDRVRSRVQRPRTLAGMGKTQGLSRDFWQRGAAAPPLAKPIARRATENTAPSTAPNSARA